jgi:hypothetical protein
LPACTKSYHRKPDDYFDAIEKLNSEIITQLIAELTLKSLFHGISRIWEKYKPIEILAISTIFFQLSTHFERNRIILPIFPLT